MGMHFEELYKISPRSLFNKMYGFRRLSRDRYEIMRLQTYHLLSPYYGEDDNFTPMDIIKYPWDEKIKEVKRERDLEAEEEANKIWRQIDKGKKGKK